MGIIVNQQDGRSKLQEKVAAELREKAKKTNLPEQVVDGVEDVEYLKGTKQTTTLAGAWLFIVVAAAALIVMIMIQG